VVSPNSRGLNPRRPQLKEASIERAPTQGGSHLRGYPLRGAPTHGPPLEGAPLKVAPLKGARTQGGPLLNKMSKGRIIFSYLLTEEALTLRPGTRGGPHTNWLGLKKFPNSCVGDLLEGGPCVGVRTHSRGPHSRRLHLKGPHSKGPQSRGLPLKGVLTQWGSHQRWPPHKVAPHSSGTHFRGPPLKGGPCVDVKTYSRGPHSSRHPLM
jgi:hypothetical protein